MGTSRNPLSAKYILQKYRLLTYACFVPVEAHEEKH